MLLEEGDNASRGLVADLLLCELLVPSRQAQLRKLVTKPRFLRPSIEAPQLHGRTTYLDACIARHSGHLSLVLDAWVQGAPLAGGSGPRGEGSGARQGRSRVERQNNGAQRRGTRRAGSGRAGIIPGATVASCANVLSLVATCA